ncbi:MAG: hypothetical protein JWN39_2558 [Ilumatobacteraceae bacterium]|nr:hypothetical protein [Ilumatobacteraceae bacterium]
MTYGPDPTVEVPHPIIRMGWEQLTFVHWAYDPAVVQRLLPEGLRAHLFEDRAWVSLVPFRMRVRFPLVGVVPYFNVFPETNVRTYVTAEDGTEGIWFFSLDAARLAAVTAARVGYRLPYMWSSMSVDVSGTGDVGDTATYDCVRRLPGPRGASSHVSVRIGERADDALRELDHFLSARWRLYSRMFGADWGARANHPRWPLHTAELLRYDDELIAAAGFPEPTGEPIVQYSPGVEVAVSIPRRTRPNA